MKKIVAPHSSSPALLSPKPLKKHVQYLTNVLPYSPPNYFGNQSKKNFDHE